MLLGFSRFSGVLAGVVRAEVHLPKGLSREREGTVFELEGCTGCAAPGRKGVSTGGLCVKACLRRC